MLAMLFMDARMSRAQGCAGATKRYRMWPCAVSDKRSVEACWGNSNQQSFYWERPLPYFLAMNCDVLMLEGGSNQARDIALLKHHKTDKNIGIGVVDHTRTTVESPEQVAATIRHCLECVPPERLIITADCGFGREGLSRRIAFFKCVSLVMGANIVRRELGHEEAYVRAADQKFAFNQA